MNEDKISPHVTFTEVTRSDTAKAKGIVNMPTEEEITNLKLVCNYVYEKIRAHFDKPIYISSAFRCTELNKAVGGKPTSQHQRGQALDLDCSVYGGLTNDELFNYVKNSDIEFDQLILEGSKNKWVHVSFVLGHNRKQVFEIKNP